MRVDAPRGLRFDLAVVALVVCFLGNLLAAGGLYLERAGVGPSDLSCPVPSIGSTYASSHWQWWPPGRVCDAPASPDAPTLEKGVLVVCLPMAFVGLAAVVLLMSPSQPERQRSTAVLGLVFGVLLLFFATALLVVRLAVGDSECGLLLGSETAGCGRALSLYKWAAWVTFAAGVVLIVVGSRLLIRAEWRRVQRDDAQPAVQ